MTKTPSAFAGTWKLKSWTSLKNGAPAGYPMGEDGKGQIIYSDDGHMCAFLMRADFSGQENVGTPETCIAYGGEWQFSDGRISHKVDFSNLPHWVGRTLVRLVQRDGDIMTLKTEPEFSKSGSRYEHVLIWQKAA